MSMISIQEVTKDFGSFRAVDDLSIEVAQGEFLVIVGPSGCGKTTVLRVIAGLEKASSGTIRVAGHDVTEAEPGARDIAMVFQSYALFPHMSVFDNLAFGMRLYKVQKVEIERRIRDVTGLLGLEDYLHHKPSQLSGGQRQRVAMGRAIIRRPNAFLMDEPLSNLDAKLRVQMRFEVKRLQREIGTTTVYVTHDQVEAMTMGDRIAVMSAGRLQQIDTPSRIYSRPANLNVAGFMGSPSMNLLDGIVEADGGLPSLRLGDNLIPLDERWEHIFPSLSKKSGEKVVFGIRPEHLAVSDAAGQARALEGSVKFVEDLGAEAVAHVQVSTAQVHAIGEGGDTSGVDNIDWSNSGGAMIDVRVDAGGDSIWGKETVALRPDTTKIHLFDAETGQSLRAN